MDSVVEYVFFKFTGISIVHSFEQLTTRVFGPQFHGINLVLFSGEIFLVLVFYALIKRQYTSFLKPVLITGFYFVILSTLFLSQMINLCIYPIRTAVVFTISTLFSFPPAILAGAFIYNQLTTELDRPHNKNV